MRPDIEVGPIRPPQRLAPYSYAVGAEVGVGDLGIDRAPEEVPTDSTGSAFGRLILLYDPQGHEAWSGTIRLVAYIQVDVEADLATDPMLPEVAWSWLTDALGVPEGDNSTPGDSDPSDGRPVLTALGGTVTSTSSVRYGDIAGPPRAHQLELRASWTALHPDLGPHLEAFCDVLATAAGLPPTGITALKSAD